MMSNNIYIDEFVKQKAILVNNINSKGISANQEEKFNSLIEKVGEIINLKGEVRVLNKENTYTSSVTAAAINYPDTVPSESVDIGVKVKRKNLINSALWSTASSGKGLTIQYLPDEDCFVANGTITPTSSETSADIGIKSVNIPINKGKKYTLSVKYISGESEMSNLLFVCRDAFGSGGNQVIKVDPLLDKQNHTATNVINATAIKEVRFYFYMGGTTPKTVTNYKFRIQLEESGAATDYEPYQSETEYTPSADGTVTGIKNLTPITTLITEGGITMDITAGTYKEILPSEGKTGITEIWQEI